MRRRFVLIVVTSAVDLSAGACVRDFEFPAPDLPRLVMALPVWPKAARSQTFPPTSPMFVVTLTVGSAAWNA
jgi:hypothetical protein